MTIDLSGTRALVTGASSGIGAALAVGLAEHGAVVGICARREAELGATLDACRAHQPDCRSWTIDLADLDAVSPFALRADDQLGGIDLLVNNAGIPKRRRVEDLTLAEVDQVMTINYLSPVRLMMALLPRMLARGSGKIVNISSVAARLSPAGEAAYSASKAAVTAWSESLAVELWDTPVSVHLMNPGVIDTPLFQLPGNDPLLAPVEPLPTWVMVEALLAQLESGQFETYVPEWFGEVAEGKATNLEGYLSGSAEWARQAKTGDTSIPDLSRLEGL
jgi:NAD(P)-dependent dehydrogenase (short-subunit alcohol dehydrogenase family)